MDYTEALDHAAAIAHLESQGCQYPDALLKEARQYGYAKTVQSKHSYRVRSAGDTFKIAVGDRIGL